MKKKTNFAASKSKPYRPHITAAIQPKGKPTNRLHGAEPIDRKIGKLCEYVAKNPLCIPKVLLHGGQVVSWKNQHREELLFYEQPYDLELF